MEYFVNTRYITTSKIFLSQLETTWAHSLPQALGKHTVIKTRGIPKHKVSSYNQNVKGRRSLWRIPNLSTSGQKVASPSKKGKVVWQGTSDSHMAVYECLYLHQIINRFTLETQHDPELFICAKKKWLTTGHTELTAGNDVNYLHDKWARTVLTISSAGSTKTLRRRHRSQLALQCIFSTTNRTASKWNHPLSRGDEMKAPSIPYSRSDIALARNLIIHIQARRLCNDYKASSTGQCGP